MTGPSRDHLPPPRPGLLLRTKELKAWSANPNRLAREWEAKGLLRPYGNGGMWLVLGPGGAEPRAPTLQKWVQVFLQHERFLITGPGLWNQIGLDVSYVVQDPKCYKVMIYNHSRTQSCTFEGDKILFCRRRFPPAPPTREWCVVDLYCHGPACRCNWDEELDDRVWWALKQSRLNGEKILDAVSKYGTREAKDHFRALVASLDGPRRPRPVGTRMDVAQAGSQ